MAEMNEPNMEEVTAKLHKEIDAVPEADRVLLLRLVQSYREGVCEEKDTSNELSPAESFRAGWRDMKAGRTYPIDTLWDRVEAS